MDDSRLSIAAACEAARTPGSMKDRVAVSSNGIKRHRNARRCLGVAQACHRRLQLRIERQEVLAQRLVQRLQFDQRAIQGLGA